MQKARHKLHISESLTNTMKFLIPRIKIHRHKGGVKRIETNKQAFKYGVFIFSRLDVKKIREQNIKKGNMNFIGEFIFHM